MRVGCNPGCFYRSGSARIGRRERPANERSWRACSSQTCQDDDECRIRGGLATDARGLITGRLRAVDDQLDQAQHGCLPRALSPASGPSMRSAAIA